MATITSKLQVTIPKAIAVRYGLKPGDVIEWEAAGDSIRVIPPASRPSAVTVEERLRLFDQKVERQRARERGRRRAPAGVKRGWTRDDLYEDRGRAR